MVILLIILCYRNSIDLHAKIKNCLKLKVEKKVTLLQRTNVNLLLFYAVISVIKDVQDEMLKGETSGQIFAVVHIGKCVRVSTFLKKSIFFPLCIRRKCMLEV